MKTLFRFCVACVIAIACISCASSPVVGYRRGPTNDSLMVSQEFKFSTGPSSVSHMQHTWTIPAGVYHEVATDSSGTYYRAPTALHLKARLGIALPGGLYRRDGHFFTYQEPATTNLTRIYIGSEPYVWDQIPAELSKLIKQR